MISVCLAAYNGEKYIKEQLDSILCQLSTNDEVIVSDDGSTDNTLSIIAAYNDSRIKIFHNEIKKGIIGNFENALNQAQGDYIILSDHDDVWLPHKVEKCLSVLQHAVLVFSNVIVVDENLNKIRLIYEKENRNGFIRNIIKNNFIGATIAFNKSLLYKILPIPSCIHMHDHWIGLIAELTGTVVYISEPLILYRRHSDNASLTGEKSKYNFYMKLKIRINIVRALLIRYFNIYKCCFKSQMVKNLFEK
ncbi:MAG: glycosyltransferase family 2 protein [Prevotellaceae bacterium]|jgi:glycosyltransferase involved in cell wall biosynthesis|nr:glycosyltransferase family 2 protein [Prevotellaceae bacterium]